MRDLIERGGFVSPIHRAAVMQAHDDLVAAFAEPADEQNGVGRSSVHAGAGTAVLGLRTRARFISTNPRASEEVRP